MTAQIGNGGYKIYPRIVADENNQESPNDKFVPLYKNSKNIKIVQDAMYASTNEARGLHTDLELTIQNINLQVKLEQLRLKKSLNRKEN